MITIHLSTIVEVEIVDDLPILISLEVVLLCSPSPSLTPSLLSVYALNNHVRSLEIGGRAVRDAAKGEAEAEERAYAKGEETTAY